MRTIRILIVDKHCPEDVFDKLRNKGFEVTVNPTVDKAFFLSEIANYQCVVVSGDGRLDKDILEKAENLELIIRAGSGMEIIDTKFAIQKGITCLNTPEGNRNAVAEHAIGLILSLLNHIVRSHSQLKNRKWLREENRGVELAGKTVGLLGYGNTGMSLAKRLRSFDVKVLAYDKFKYDFSDEFVEEATLEQIFEQTDIHSIHLPLTKDTHLWVDEYFLNKFKKQIYLINTARGEIVSCSDLLKALTSGKVKAAGLDVLENEKLTTFSEIENEWFDALIAHENVIITPHVAGWSKESRDEIGRFTLTKVLKFFQRE